MLKLKKIVAVFTAVLFVANAVGFADMIEIDNKTETTINRQGNTYDISTKTVVDNTGFNSFKKFNVDEGTIVNLQLTGNMANLVNLVSDEKTSIYGTLNSFKNGKIAGNVFFLNPNGIVVGETGVINVGALTLATPTKEFLESVINSDKQVSSILTKAILAGDMPINETGLISIKGKINAFNGVQVSANDINIEKNGEINTKYSVADIVNLGDIEDTEVKIKDGKVIIEAVNKVVDEGKISADGKNPDDENIGKNGDVEIVANEIELDGAKISDVNNVNIKGTEKTDIINETDIKAEDSVAVNSKKTTLKNGKISADKVKLAGTETVEINDNAYIKGNIVSIEAKDLTLGSNTIDSDNKLGTDTDVEIKTENITITENQNLNKNYLLTTTKDITVNEGVSIKTNGNNIVFDAENINIKKNAILDTVLSNNVAGGIFMEAKTITIGDNVSLNATPVNNPLLGGNIILLAKNEDKGYIYYTTESKIDIGKNANINGKNILITAVSVNEKIFEPEKDDNAVEEIAKTVGNISLGMLSGYSLFGAFFDVNVNAILNIGEGAVISATENLDIISDVTSNATMSVFGSGFAVVVGLSNFSSEVNIDKNVRLYGNNVNVSALTNSNFAVSAMAMSTAASFQDKFDLSLAIGILEGNTTLNIKEGAIVLAKKDANIKAKTDKSFLASASASAFEGGVVGAAVTYANSDVTNSVNINGQITAQNVNVNSVINAKKDRIVSSTGTGDSAVTNFFVDRLMNGAIDWIKGKFTEVKTSKESNVTFSFTGAVTYNDNNNTSEITLGEKSAITSSQDTNIISNIIQKDFRQASTADVSSYKKHSKENGASVGLSLLYNTNKAIITAKDGASIDAGNNLNIESKYYMPFDMTYVDFIDNFKEGNYGALIDNLLDKLNGDLGFQNGFCTTWANSTITVGNEEHDSKIGIAGAANIAFFNTDSKVNLGAVKINQNLPGNNVNINALADTFALNLSGNWGITFFGNDVKGNGIGASYQQMEYDTNIKATIADNAKITVNDNFSLEAKDEQMDITISIAGGKANGTFGLEGTLNWVNVDNDTIASIGNAEVNILNTTGKNPSIYARDDGLYINIAGAVLLAGNVGVGLGIVLTDIDRNTQAYLGQNYISDNLIPVENLNTFNSNRGLDITAINKGAVFAYSLAATASSKSNDKTKSESSSGGNYGVGISGAYGETNITDTALAYVHNAKYDSKKKLNIDSHEKTKINTVSPGASLAIGKEGSGAGGVAGSVSINNIANTAMAFISGNSDIKTDNLKLNSYSDSNILSVAASVAVAISKGGEGIGVSIAGSVSINEIANKISSYISGSNIEISDVAEVKAEDESDILAIAGGVSVSNTIGVGASVSINTIKNTVTAYMDKAIMNVVNNIILSAINTSDIKGIAGTVGLTTSQGLAAAVSVTINEIENETKSYINDSEDISSTEGGISLNSKDESTMYSVAGGASGAIEGQALGAGAGKSIINNTIESYINNSNVKAKKDVDVKADSNAEIQTASAGIAIAGGKFAGSGSVGINEITTTINSKIDGSIIVAEGNITVKSMSDNNINFYGGSLSGSPSVSGGGTLVLNTVKDKATAKINNSYVKAKDVNVKSDVKDKVAIYSVNGGFSGAGGLEASITLNSIENDSIAQITNCSGDGKKIEATGNVSVIANNKLKENVYGGALEVAGTGAVGAVVEVSKFNNITKANIDNSIVEAAGDVNVKTDSKQVYNAIIASGGLAGTVGIAGNVAVVIIDCINEAMIKDSSVNSKSNVSVEANDVAIIGDEEKDEKESGDLFIVGSLGVGIEGAGIAGSVAVTNIKNNTISKIVDSSINATKKLSVKSTTDYLINTILPAVGGGMYGGLGLVTGIATIDATTQAVISQNNNKNTVINEDEDYKGYEQSVEVDATSKSKITNVAAGGGVGAVGIGAGINVNTMDNKTTAAIGDNVKVYAQKDITVHAKNTKKVEDFVVGLGAGIAGLSGSISVSNLGSAIDFESNKETGKTKNTVNNELDRTTQINFEDGDSSFFNGVNKDLSKYKTNVNSTFDENIEKDNSTSAFIGKNVIVKAGNKVEVKAEDELITDNVAGSVSLGAVALGASVLLSNLYSSTKAYIDSGTEVEAKSILIKSVSNVTSKVLAFLGAGSMYGSLGAVVGKTNSTNDTLAYSNAKQLKGTEKIEIIADATATENSQTVGVVAGAGAVGASVSIIDKDGTTSAFIGDNSKVDGENLTVNAKNNFDIYAEAEAGAGGIVAGSGAVAIATVNDVINATIGKNSVININNVLNLLTNSSVFGHAKVIGANLGALAVGVSDAQTKITLANNVIVDEDTKIKADKVVVVAEQTKADTEVESMAVAGALIGANGASATSSVEGEVKTTVKNNSDINAVTGMQIESKSTSKQKTEAERYAGGAASFGGNDSTITSDIDTQTEIKDNAKLVSKNLKFQAISKNELYSETESGSGGLIDVATAQSNTENTSDTNIILGKAVITGDSVELLSENTTSQDSTVDMVSVGAIQGSGISADNISTQNVLIEFDGSKITSNKFITNAKNNFVKNKYEKSVDFTGGGFISDSSNESNTEIKNTTKVVFDKDADIKTIKDSEGNSTFIVNAYNDIKAVDFATLSSGGLVAVPTVVSKINNSINKAVVEIAKATIKTANDLVINTKSDLDISSIANLSSYGAATVVHGESSAESTVDNQIILKEGADVLSEGSTYLYLTKPYNDKRAVTNLKAKTEIWNKSALPFDADSTADAILNINNFVDIQKNAQLKCTDSIYIEGDMPIHDISSVYDYVSTYGDIASSDKVSNTKKTLYTKINIDGELLTGVNNIEDIEITLNREIIFGPISSEVNWDITTENLGENLIKELEKLEKLQAEYSSNEILKEAYQKDIERVKDDLGKLGLLDENGHVVKKDKDVLLDVDFITFDNIYANRGDIVILADDLTGSGTISAQANAEVVIENNSDLFLRFNDIKIAGSGNGIIFYNTNAVRTKQDIEQMNKKVKTTNFDNENIISQQEKTTPLISITSTYENEDGRTTNIELLGNMENISGLIKVDALGTIYAKGNILGETIDIKTQADIVQTYTEGFRHIGGAPEVQWASIIDSGTSNSSSDNTPTIANTNSIIGNNVFISGRYLNINGLIQAGIADYNLVIDDGDLSLKIGSIQDAKNDYLTKLNAHDPAATKLYQLADKYGNAIAYYNVETDKIELSNINVSGGHLELYGEIINTSLTGAGELRVLDGYTKLNIENNSSYDLVLNSINIGNKIEGVIKITDISKRGGDGKFLETIYTKLGNSIKQVDSTTRDANGNPNNEIIIDGLTTQYNPTENLRYNWMTGQETLTRITKYYEDNSFWGMDWMVKDKQAKSTDSIMLNETPLLEGSVLITDTSDKNYKYTYEEYELSNLVVGKEQGSYSTGWWIFSTKTYWYKTITEQGSKLYRTHSIKASNPIKINFVGHADSQATISSSNDIYLNGTIKNLTGDVSITSVNGAITNNGCGSITAKNITLNAKTGIGNNNDIIIDLRDGILNAVTDSGNINLYSKGNLVFDNVTNKDGNISLSSMYNIVGVNENSLIKGNQLYIASKLGSVGTADNVVNMQVKEIASADVSEDMFINQTGDLGVKEIKVGKDLNLFVDGSIYDTNSNDFVDTRTEQEKQNSWNKMELFKKEEEGGAGWKEEQLKYAINSNRFTDSSLSDLDNEQPNITANKVTITVTGSIGKQEGAKTIYLTNYSSLSLEDKNLLATVEKDNISFEYDDNGNLIAATIVLREDVDIISKEITLKANKKIYLGSQDDININQIEAGANDTIIISSLGGIYNVNTEGKPNIIGKDLKIESFNGTMGTEEKPLVLSLTGSLSALSFYSIYLNSVKDLAVTYISSPETINITTNNNLTNANMIEYVNINAKEINIEANNIGDSNNYIGVMLTEEESVLNIKSTGDIYINNAKLDEINDNSTVLKIGNIEVANDANIKSQEDILNANENSKITANNLNFVEVKGNIGDPNDKILVDTNKVTANATGSVNLRYNKTDDFVVDNITSQDGNINLDSSGNIVIEEKISAQKGDVNLESGGNVKDLLPDNEASIFANNISIKADSIGTQDNSLGVNTSATEQGYLNAETENGINIVSPNKNLDVEKTVSNNSDIYLASDKSLVVKNLGGDNENIKANNITIKAKNGQIGSENNFVVVDVNNEGGKVNLDTTDGIYLKQTEHTFDSDYVYNTNNGNINLDLPSSNVRIKDIKTGGNKLNIMFRDRENINDIMIDNRDVKNLTINPVSTQLNLIDCINNLMNINSILNYNHKTLNSIKEPVKLISFNNIGIED